MPTPEQLKTIRKLSKEPEKVSKEYQLCVDYWLKEFKIGWDFRAMHGQALKQIITKIKRRIKEHNKPVTEENIFNTFVFICQNLPEWYQDKDLPTINSKFNEITEQIKRPKGNRIDADNLSRIANERYGND